MKRSLVAGLALAEASLSESRSLYNRSKELESTQAISASSLEALLAQVTLEHLERTRGVHRRQQAQELGPGVGRQLFLYQR